MDEIDLERYLAGVLKRRETQRVEEHVASCSICLGRLDRVRADEVFVAKVKDAYTKQLPDDILKRLRRRSHETLSHQESVDPQVHGPNDQAETKESR